MPQALNDEQWQPIDTQILAGRKIEAIKLHRQATGSDLSTAKDAVEQREQTLRATSPEKFTRARTGCMGALVLMAIVVTVFSTLLFL